VDIETERRGLEQHINRPATEEELVMYLNHPGDALKTIEFRHKFGNPNRLPVDVWFEGLEPGRELIIRDTNDKPHLITILDIGPPDEEGMSLVRYMLDAETFSYPVKVAEALKSSARASQMADKDNPFHVACPSNGDLWIMYVSPGDIVKKGEELFNITIMKQEKAVLSPMDAVVKRVVKTANYKEDKKMVPVREGELIVELGEIPRQCAGCDHPMAGENYQFCPMCGTKL
jgi:pyruvate carboxylase